MQDENLLPFEANVALKILKHGNDNACLYLMNNLDIDEKTWISSLKYLSYDLETLKPLLILGHCYDMVNEDYKLIPRSDFSKKLTGSIDSDLSPDPGC